MYKRNIIKFVNSLNHQTKLNISTTPALSHNDSKPPVKTCLYDFHVAHGGKIVDFAGFLMPVQYKDQGIQESHFHTRNKCSLFDVSHMMQTRVYGKDRFKFIEKLVVSDIQGLKPNNGTLTVFTNENGGIIDDLIVNNTSLNYLYIVSNAGCADKDLKHLRDCETRLKDEKYDINLELIEDRGLLALQGPKMAEVLQPGVDFDLSKFPFMNTHETSVYSIENCRITRCGYTGEDGVEISVPIQHTAALAERLLQVKSEKNDEALCKLAGLGARDTLRLEAGLCLYGNDIDDKTTPIEAGLAWLIGKRRRELRDFPGADVILRELKEKPSKRRVGMKLLNNAGPSARQHMKILDNQGDCIGEVTSGCPSPSLKQNIAMGYVNTKFSQPDTKILIEIRNKKHEAEVVKLPFVPTRYFHLDKK
jgi:aminomethyltransferase